MHVLRPFVLALALAASGCVYSWSAPLSPEAAAERAFEPREDGRARLRRRARARLALRGPATASPTGHAGALAPPRLSLDESWQAVLPAGTMLRRTEGGWRLDARPGDDLGLGSPVVLDLALSRVDGGLTALAVVGWALLAAATVAGGTLGGFFLFCVLGGCSSG